MKKIPAPWHLIIGLILGLGLGLVISWGIAPVETTDAPPSLLRSDFKDKYRALIAYAYASTDDFDRAKDRLASLTDSNSIEALQSQAQRALADDASPESVDALAALAADLEYETIATQITATSTRFFTQTPRASRTFSIGIKCGFYFNQFLKQAFRNIIFLRNLIYKFRK